MFILVSLDPSTIPADHLTSINPQDQTPGAAERRVRYRMDDETEELLKRRYQIIK